MTSVAHNSLRHAEAAGSPATAPLARDRIAAIAAHFDVEAVQKTGSTNADLLQRVRQAQPERPILRAALLQTAGRGRLGRRWHASAGGALLFSLAIPLATADARIAAATLACGIGAAEALRHAGVEASLKWPNDLLLGGRKLGGVLCELAVDHEARRTLVVGVGVNVHLDAAMRDSIGQPAAALDQALLDAAAQREALIGRIALAVEAAVRLFEAEGFVPLQPRFMALFAHRGAAVDLFELDVRAVSGRVLGVDGEGRLLLETSDGLRVFSSGELTLREVT